ncbi:DUF3159 domain-containing protein, partial [Streptomyces sp. SID5914]|nr:DUF3159 domain-containing protein [Streptomyces sp. SID5914]
ILFPLYWWADTEQLGWVLVTLKIPPFLLAVWLTWVFLAKAPAPIDVFAEMEAAEEAEKAEKAEKAERERREREQGETGGALPGPPEADGEAADLRGGRHRKA